MINTEKVIGFYEDVFGNEVDIYEEITKYTVCYKGCLFDGDQADKWNSVDTDSWTEAKLIYNMIQNQNEVYITDNEYSVTFSHDEWN